MKYHQLGFGSNSALVKYSFKNFQSTRITEDNSWSYRNGKIKIPSYNQGRFIFNLISKYSNVLQGIQGLGTYSIGLAREVLLKGKAHCS